MPKPLCFNYGPAKSGVSKDDRETLLIEQANDPSEWKMTALDLNYAADVLWKIAKPPQAGWGKSLKSILAKFKSTVEPDWVKLIHSFILLKSYALENLVKAVYVKRKKESGEVIRENDPLLDKHLDAKLCKESQISLSKQEEGLVNRLHDCIMWAGRYPIPKNARRDSVPWFNTATDLEMMDSLINRIMNLI